MPIVEGQRRSEVQIIFTVTLNLGHLVLYSSLHARV